ncbi:hypothetical protein ACFUYE_24725, partial [Micromonospora humida]|uniref:hypothetical protein n=1 Tax=Micromonospora humida TaxID=2809018 RepID=UPI00366CFB9F
LSVEANPYPGVGLNCCIRQIGAFRTSGSPPARFFRHMMHFDRFSVGRERVVIPTVASAAASVWENVTDGRTGERKTIIVGSGPGGRKR